MKKAILSLVVLLVTVNGYAKTFEFYQTQNIHNKIRLNNKTGELYQIQSDGLKVKIQSGITPKSSATRYSLYETKNMWNYILLDNFSGKLWQCQYSVDANSHRGCITINNKALSSTNRSKFTIEPMTSMFQFYLVNQDSGEMWQFQWNFNEDYRWIKKL